MRDLILESLREDNQDNHICYHLKGCKKESFEKTRHVKNNDKSKKYTLRGQRNTRYHDRILSNKKKSYILT